MLSFCSLIPATRQARTQTSNDNKKSLDAKTPGHELIRFDLDFFHNIIHLPRYGAFDG